MFILPGNADARNRFVQQRRRVKQQSHVSQHTARELCQYFVVYVIALIYTPAMAIFNVIVYAQNTPLKNYDNPCSNAMTSIEGFMVLYVLMCGFWIGYAVFHSPPCATEIRFATWNRTFYRILLLAGFILLIGTIAFNLAASYWATETQFRNLCEKQSSLVYNSTLANVVLTHVVFDLICFALIPILFEMYQWL